MHLRPALRRRDPGALTRRGRGAAVAADRDLVGHVRAPQQDPRAEPCVLAPRPHLDLSGGLVHRDPRRPQRPQPVAADAGVGIAGRDHHPAHAGSDQRVGAGRRTAVVGAWLEADIHGRTGGLAGSRAARAPRRAARPGARAIPHRPPARRAPPHTPPSGSAPPCALPARPAPDTAPAGGAVVVGQAIAQPAPAAAATIPVSSANASPGPGSRRSPSRPPGCWRRPGNSRRWWPRGHRRRPRPPPLPGRGQARICGSRSSVAGMKPAPPTRVHAHAQQHVGIPRRLGDRAHRVAGPSVTPARHPRSWIC